MLIFNKQHFIYCISFFFFFFFSAILPYPDDVYVCDDLGFGYSILYDYIDGEYSISLYSTSDCSGSSDTILEIDDFDCDNGTFFRFVPAVDNSTTTTYSPMESNDTSYAVGSCSFGMWQNFIPLAAYYCISCDGLLYTF